MLYTTNPPRPERLTCPYRSRNPARDGPALSAVFSLSGKAIAVLIVPRQTALMRMPWAVSADGISRLERDALRRNRRRR